jgi:hypothetical protein
MNSFLPAWVAKKQSCLRVVRQNFEEASKQCKEIEPTMDNNTLVKGIMSCGQKRIARDIGEVLHCCCFALLSVVLLLVVSFTPATKDGKRDNKNMNFGNEALVRSSTGMMEAETAMKNASFVIRRTWRG